MTSEETLELFAVLIGINYDTRTDNELSRLSGAINDVNDFEEYLKTNLRIPCNQIITLTEDQATRSAIINSFITLATDSRIKKGAAILIYYAGHGAQFDPPQNHEAGGEDSKIQAILPYDYGCADTENKLIPPIFDYTLEKLLSYIAQKKGDNITVIMDSCFSGSSTRSESSKPPTDVRSVDLTTKFPQKLDLDILKESDVKEPQMFRGCSSHILISACGAAEVAKERNNRGVFTSSLLRFLREPEVPRKEIQYWTMLDDKRFPHIHGQNPQVEGLRIDRALFSTDIPSEMIPRLTAAVIQKSADLPEFRVYIPPQNNFTGIYNNLKEKFKNLTLCNQMDKAHLEASLTNKETDHKEIFLKFNILHHKVVYSYQKTMNNNFKALDSIFTAAIHFYTFFHHCEDKDKSISENMDFEFYRLEQEKTNSESDNHNRLCPLGPNLYHNGVVNLDYVNAQEGSGNMSYGMRIVNNSEHELYVNVFIFSLWDLGIGVHVRSNGSNSRYLPDVQLKKNGRSFAIGYGNSASEALKFEIPSELDHAVWFLKIYLSTQAVNLEHIKQSPTPSSEQSRGVRGMIQKYFGQQEDLGQQETWSTIVIPIIKRRARGPFWSVFKCFWKQVKLPFTSLLSRLRRAW